MDETLEEIPEATQVEMWHRENLGRLGITTEMVGPDELIDWHEVHALLARGCTPALAVQIVRPL